MKDKNVSRRQFLGTAAAASAFSIVPRHVMGGPGFQAPSDTVNVAAIGVGGMGATNLRGLESQNIVALCDVDYQHAAKTFEKYPNAQRYKDYRVMLEKQKDIDAVVIATPDHTHACSTLAAMQLGKHVYTQKPLTRLVSEARLLTEAAKKYDVVTSMGNQGHSREERFLVQEWIADGAIGNVTEIHVWTNRPVWTQGVATTYPGKLVPKTLDWNLYIGPTNEKAYNPIYHPFQWRGWIDFGTGALGDMGCHNIDYAFMALDLRVPTSVEAGVSMVINPENVWEKLPNRETFPRASVVRYNFPARGDKPPCSLIWYDGGMFPPRPAELEPGRKMPGNGTLYIGDKGKMLSGHGAPRIIPESKMKEYKRPPKTLERIKTSHEMNWIESIKKGVKASSKFEDAGPLTEMVLLGNVAVLWPQEQLLWDHEKMEISNNAEANEYVKMNYRKGWEISL